MSEQVQNRQASVERNTKETQIRVSVNLDGTGILKCQTGLPFLDHMLDQVARHGLIDLDIHANGDLEIDAHHTVEDLGITLRSEEHTSELQSREQLVCLLLLEKKQHIIHDRHVC